ncbi:uncharacterized protein LOC130748029 [Lotus japonicus]|uniref:Uncharacterized protein n=1 Tax=Lotus japonicus TaxID=34305 RepID=I3SIF0_LOTJA|nr:uncharacterized protein LOC130748029 [Lotus japonicus]AFK40042.1 unknown [Lotus japonicus]
MAVSVVGGGWRFLCHRRENPPNSPLFLQSPMPIRFSTTTTSWSCVIPRARDPKTGEQNSTNTSQVEDLVYVAKLAAGSFVGAGAVKYGSAVFPEITTPNLVLALSIILTPVVVAVLLLIKESLAKP